MYRATFALDLFNGAGDRKISHRAIVHMTRALTAIDRDELEAGDKNRPGMPLPAVYQSGVKYLEETQKKLECPRCRTHIALEVEDDWQDAYTCLERGIADCEDLACWRAAELQLQGVQAEVAYV